jgi:hypothetical protein
MVYHNLTDEELLREIYASHADDPLLQELAKRLEQAQDTIAVLKANDLTQD